MGHQDIGHYAAKHNDKKLNEAVAEKIKTMAKNNGITCASAHKIAKTLDMPPSEIGIQVDLMNLSISECQLGLFGYPLDSPGGGKRLNPDIVVSAELNRQLESFSKDGRIACKDCWKIAFLMKMKKTDIGSACEKNQLKIKPCQLGAF